MISVSALPLSQPSQPQRLAAYRAMENTTRLPQFGIINPIMKAIQGNRVTELLAEDIVGFGLLRSVMDYIRPWIYGTQAQQPTGKHGQHKGNLSAARERMVREAASVFSDILLPGLAGYGASRLFKASSPIKGTIIDNKVITSLLPLAQQSTSQQQFTQLVAESLLGSNNTPTLNSPKVLNALTPIMSATQHSNSTIEQYTIQLAKAMEKEQFNVKLGTRLISLQDLCLDLNKLSAVINAKPTAGASYKTTLVNSLRQLQSTNRKLVPIAMTIGAIATMASPYLNIWLTKKLDHMESYPAELGLRPAQYDTPNVLPTNNNQPNPPKSFSYVIRQIKNANFLPLLGAIVPMVVPLGLLDTNKLSNGQWRNALKLPIKHFPVRAWGDRIIKLNGFSRNLPFTSSQQIASLYALLISARLMFSRSDIEYRERLVDSALLGFPIWIFCTPALKRVAAQISDKKWGTQLLKTVGNSRMVRDELEIKSLLKTSQSVKAASLKALKRINTNSFLLSIGLLGVIEPLISMKWSKAQAHRRPQGS